MPVSHIQRTQMYADLEEQFNCSHVARQLRRRVIKGGSVSYVRQCIRCGNVSNPVKTSLALEEAGGNQIPDFDEDAEERWKTQKNEQYLSARKALDSHVSKEYETYLASPEWRERRRKVLSRADGICEGCLEQPATEVHHLTYQNVGEEFLWELVAVCEKCHARCHVESDA